MEIRGNEFTALATDGDVQLGGQDWDQRLVDYVADEFIKTHGLDPREDPNTAGRLWRECEDAKRTLSARTKASISCDYKGQAVRVEITREKFEEITQDLLDRTQFTTKQTLQAAGLNWSDMDCVLLVGGSTRMPMVARMLRELSGKEPDASVAVDEAVAHGAALHAGVLLAQQPRRNAGRADQERQLAQPGRGGHRPPHGPQAQRHPDSAQHAAAGHRQARVSHPARQPADRSWCRSSKAKVPRPRIARRSARASVRDLPQDLPAQTPIEVRFAYQENGRLTIHVTVAGTARELKHEISRANSLNPEQLDAWRQYITGAGGAAESPEVTDEYKPIEGGSSGSGSVTM